MSTYFGCHDKRITVSAFFVLVFVMHCLPCFSADKPEEKAEEKDATTIAFDECEQLIKKGDYRRSITKLKKLVESKDDKIAIHANYLSALALSENGAVADKKSAKLLRKILSNPVLNENYGRAAILLSKLELNQPKPDKEESEKILTEFLDKKYDLMASVNAYEILGDMAMENGKRSKGIDSYKLALELADRIFYVTQKKLVDCDIPRIKRKLNPPEEPKYSYDRAYGMQGREEYTKAVELYNSIIEKYPKHELTQASKYQVGQCLVGETKLEDAVKYYKDNLESITIPKWKMKFHFALGEIDFIYFLDLDAAAAEFKAGTVYADTVKDKEVAGEAYKLYGICQLMQEDYDGAVKSFDLNMKYSPKTKICGTEIPSNMIYLRKLAVEKKNPVYFADKVMQGNKANRKVQSAIFLASCFLEAGDIKGAEKIFQNVMSKKYGEPTKEQEAYATLEIAESLKLDFKFDEAKALWEKFKGDYSQTAAAPLGLFEYAQVLGMEGSHDESSDTFNIIAKKYPKSEYAAKALYVAGFVYYAKDMWPEAVEQYKKLVKKYPDSWEAKRVKEYELMESLEKMKGKK